MTREEAIERLKQGEPFSELYDEKWETALNMAIESLEEYESLAKSLNDAVELIHKLQKNEWIPCLERLPDKNGEYLVTVREDSRFAFNGERTVYGDTFQSLCQWDDCGDDVIAWMPFPEPYKENNR